MSADDNRPVTDDARAILDGRKKCHTSAHDVPILATQIMRELAAARSEIVALRALIEEFNNFACDCHQLLVGWHADGTAWSEWDQSVLDKLVALQRKTDPLKPAHLAVLPKATVDATAAEVERRGQQRNQHEPTFYASSH